MVGATISTCASVPPITLRHLGMGPMSQNPSDLQGLLHFLGSLMFSVLPSANWKNSLWP